jgi:hypothetical protein
MSLEFFWGDTRVRGVALVACVVTVVAVEAYAAVAPKRASDVITVITTTAACPFSGGGQLFDTQIRSDGSRAAFTIPAGSVLVVTGLEFISQSTAGQDVAGTLLYGNTGEEVFFTIGDVHDFGSGTNTVHHDTQVPNLVVSTSLCFRTTSGQPTPLPFVGLIHGFLTPNR